jgi:lipoyl(octanoyl) transferase
MTSCVPAAAAAVRQAVRVYELGRVPYRRAWAMQKAHVAAQVAAAVRATSDARDGRADMASTTAPPPSSSSVGDAIMMVEHDPVYTLGRGAAVENVLFDMNAASASSAVPECIRVDRGGEVTYHGPGQVVMYPLLNLANFRKDVRWLVCRVEDVVIATVKDFGLKGERVPVRFTRVVSRRRHRLRV